MFTAQWHKTFWKLFSWKFRQKIFYMAAKIEPILSEQLLSYFTFHFSLFTKFWLVSKVNSVIYSSIPDQNQLNHEKYLFQHLAYEELTPEVTTLYIKSFILFTEWSQLILD